MNFLVLKWIPFDLYLTAAGVAALVVAPRFSAAVGSLDARVARALLGPGKAEELQVRVEQLTQTRAGVVDAADAERRRLERDLHDGTQQRLVSLALQLGMARAERAEGERAQLVIAEAHEEAKAALAELRNLIRGLHPPVLEDRGLDAALSGVAARMPIPSSGSGQVTFAAAPELVTLSTDGGPATLDVPSGSYALNTDSEGGPQSVRVSTDPSASRSLTVTSGGGSLAVGMPTAGQ